jgi:pimeloyl-ACP methyl ester carboxylesterase
MFAELLDDLGIERAHVAGNSLGGWTALELARMERARSVVALGPAGLWSRGPLLAGLRLIALHAAARAGRRLGTAMAQSAASRRVLFALGVGEPGRLPPEVAARLISELADASGFNATIVDTHRRRFKDGARIAVPVTIVYGQRDRLLPRAARRREELPSQTRFLEVSRLGHVPMWNDPTLVAEIVLGNPVA